MPTNLRPRFALRVDREIDACHHSIAANAEGDAGVDKRVGGGEHLGVAVDIKRARGCGERPAVVARDAKFIECAAPAITREQELAVGLQ